MLLSEINHVWKSKKSKVQSCLMERILYFLVKRGASEAASLKKQVCLTERDNRIFGIMMRYLEIKKLIYHTDFTNPGNPLMPGWTMWYAELSAIAEVKLISPTMKALYRAKYGA